MACKQEPKGSKPPLPGLLKLTVTYQGNVGNTVTAANVLHARWSDATNHPLLDLSQLVTAFRNNWNAQIMSILSQQYVATLYTIQSLGGDGLLTQLAENHPGAQAFSALTPNCAVCISWLTGITARGGRGRTYIPGIPTNAQPQQGASTVTTAFASSLKNNALAWSNAMATTIINGQSVLIGIPSYYNKCQFRPTPLFFPVNSVVVHDRIDSQRRRMGKERLFPVTS